MNETILKLLEEFRRTVKVVPSDKARFRKSDSSLHTIIKTKEQAAQFMRSIAEADEMRRAAEKSHHSHPDLNS